MQSINLDSISNNTTGMPDCWHIDSEGKSSPEVFQKHFGLPRSLRNDKKNLDASIKRSNRLAHFMWCLLHYRYLGQPMILLGDKQTSPEAHAMARYDEAWHLRNEDELIEVAKLEQDDLASKLTDLLTLRNHKQYKPHQVRVQALANRNNTTIDRAYEVMSKCAIETWLRARNQLSEWSLLDRETKQLISEVIFAGFTLFGKSALKDVITVQPEVFAFYRTFLRMPTQLINPPSIVQSRKPQNSESEVKDSAQIQDVTLIKVGVKDVPLSTRISSSEYAKSDALAKAPTTKEQESLIMEVSSSTNQVSPQSLQALYELIGQIVQESQDISNVGPEPGHRIRDLLDHNLQRLDNLRVKISPEEADDLIERYCDAILNMVNVLEFNATEQRELVPVLRAAWKITVIAALEDARPKIWFELNLSERQQLPEFIERFRIEKANIESATSTIEEIRNQLSQAKFTARTSLKAQETHKNNAISSAYQELEIIRVEAAHALVPEGHKLDELMDNSSLLEKIYFEVDGLDLQVLLGLKDVLSRLTQTESLNDVPINSSPVQNAAALNQVVAPPSVPSPTSSKVDPKPAFKTDTNEAVISQKPTEITFHADNTDRQGTESSIVSSESSELITLATDEALETELIQPQTALDDNEDEGTTAPDVIGVDRALKHLHWSESKVEAQQAFRISYDQYSQIPRNVLEAVALHWIEAGHLNVAAQILRDASESTLVSEQVLDSSLLRSAFYGMNLWPKDREALSFTQRDLNLINHRDLEYQLDRKPTGKIVPYLLVCATLHPAIFAGGQTQAATLLRLAASHFDEHLSRLITHTADFSLRGGRLDLEALRNEQAYDTQLAATKLQDQVVVWIDLNQQRTNRWHALRLALRNCVNEPSIAAAILAIKSGERGDVSSVQYFVDMYSSHTESRKLLDKLVLDIRADAPVNDNIDSQAYTSFCQQLDALVSIANAWLLEVAPSDMRPKDIQDFLQKFHSLLEHSIHNLENHPGHSDLEHRAGSTLVLKLLQKLDSEIKSTVHNIWRFDQTNSIFLLPQTLAHLDMGDVGVDLRLEWFAMRLTSPNWLDDMLDLARRHNAHWVRLLLLNQLQELGGQHDSEIDTASNHIGGVRSELKKSIEQFRHLSLQGFSVGIDIISEDEHLLNVDQVNQWLDELSNRKPYVDISDIESDVRMRVRSMEKLLNSIAAQLDEEFNRELLGIQIKVGPDAVSEEWRARARQALEIRNLSLVRELINQLKEHSDRNARLVGTSLLENAELATFMRVQKAVYDLLHQHPNPREAGERVIQEQPGGLDYGVNKVEFKSAISTLLEWRNKGRNRRAALEKATYEGMTLVLQFIGIEVINKQGKSDVLASCEYSDTGDFRRLKVRISRPSLPKGFPLFQGDIGSSQLLNIIFAQGEWNQAGLVELIERHGQPDRAILIIGYPLSSEERNAFASFCRDRKCTIFILDPVILSYVSTARHLQVMLETFLRVSAAWTYFNPYTRGDARLPAPPEMRFGREKDIASLVEPRGAALVYGGRQLGKTTLLNAAVQEFKKRDPANNHAYYMPMDGIFQHVVERKTNVKKRLFERLASKLFDDNVLTKTVENSQMDPEERLRQEFLRPGTSRVLFCLDEIDSALNEDAATNFELVRSLKGLVNDPYHRFRVVFAGLNNVNRFRTYPNVPLEQLGSPLEVGILSSQDARSLIMQPLTALGYRLDEPELVDRIMAFTNRHPSLLHIFCSELVEQLGHHGTHHEGLRSISHIDIENVENNSDVRRLSGERFDMTLNLDKRYTVVVYGLIATYDKNIGKFTVGKALEVARMWVPEEFEQMSESGFESLLLELVGLGVLRVDDKAKRVYALRNQSILQLIGSKDDIEHKLQQAIRGLKDHEQDVLTCHATGSMLIPSPLSLQDERMILLASPPEGAPKYSVSLVMGTEALGMTMKAMQEGFNAINEFQSGSMTSKYETHVVKDAALMELKRFAEVIHTSIDLWASVRAAVVLISLEGCSSVDRIMDMISIATEKAAKATRLKHTLRLVFLFDARAMWSWYSHYWLTAAPNEIGGQVNLNRWTHHACESLLDQQGMSVTPEQGEKLHMATEGWYVHLMKFIEVRKKKESASSFNDFSKIFTPLDKTPQKDFDKFVQMTGMNSLSWSFPLAGKLKEFELLSNFSREDLQTAIEFMNDDTSEFLITPEQADSVVRWWAALRVIEVNTKKQSKDADREGQITYGFVPSIQRAVSEREGLDGAKGMQA